MDRVPRPKVIHKEIIKKAIGDISREKDKSIVNFFSHEDIVEMVSILDLNHNKVCRKAAIRKLDLTNQNLK
jgi:hypothetical protein